jgi:predicted TPR repeat methyltransferase
LLDVGCAAGFFVAEAYAHGWEAEGIDVAEEMVEWGRLHLSNRLELTPFAELSREPSSFDVVTMWDYIEHSIDPSAEIERAHELLAPGGLLALSTGDIESRVARITGNRWHLLTPKHHNYFFGSTTLEAMLDRAGFDVLFMVHDACWYSIAHLAYKLETLLPGGLGRALSHRLRRSWIGKVDFPVNLFDIATVVARKRDYA